MLTKILEGKIKVKQVFVVKLVLEILQSANYSHSKYLYVMYHYLVLSL